MRKGIKILGKVFAAALLLLLILPVTVSLLLDISVVQNAAVQALTSVVSRELGTTVSIDRVHLGLFSRIRIDGFYVEDYGRDTLLYVGRLDTHVTSLGILGGGLAFGRGEISDAKLYLRQMPDGEMNVKQLVARISDPDKPRKGKFRLSLRRASIENMDICLERLDRRDPAYGIDFSHMHLYGIRARVDDFTIDGQAIYATIESFAARERSGFALETLSGRFYMTQGCLGFSDARIATAQSDIRIPYISLVGNSWSDYKDFLGEVRIDGALRQTRFSTDDVAYFAPRLRDWHLAFSDLDMEVAGVVSDFTGRIRRLELGDGTTLAAEASVKGLPEIRKTRFEVSVPALQTSAAAVDGLSRSVRGAALPPQVLEVLSRAGEIVLQGDFQGMMSSFDLQLDASSQAGDVACRMTMSPLPGGLHGVTGRVSSQGLRLGSLLGDEELVGSASFTARVDGMLGRGIADGNVLGDVTQLDFNGYRYDSLRFDGRLRNREFDGRISARDRNLDFDFFGMVDLNDTVPHYDFTMDLHHADLVRLNVNGRDSVSQLSGHLIAKAGGRSLDDLNGMIRVFDARYRYNDKEVTASELVVRGENAASSKFVELRSDFADVTFRSKTSYRTIFQYLRQSAWRYLPLPGDAPRDTLPVERRRAVPDDYSLLSVKVRDFNPIADAVSAGLQIADGSTLQLLFNPAGDQMSLRVNSEYVERRRMLATRLVVNASNFGDSLAMYASAEDLYAGVLHFPRFSLSGGAKQGRVQLTAGFSDTAGRASGVLSLRAGLAPGSRSESRVMELRILPSHLTRGDKTWQIYARRILLDTARVDIDRFRVMNQEQELLLDGVASRSRDDSVTLRLRNFDVTPLTQIAEQMGYVIEGRTNGSATMKSLLHGAEVTADIMIDSMAVNGIGAPPMRLVSRWDFARNRAGVTVTDRIKRDTLIRGFYAPAQVRYYARLAVDSLDLGLLDPLLSGVVSSTEGLASVDLVLQGQRRQADLGGAVRVRGVKTTVDFTRVPYTMPEAVLEVRNNRFTASDVPVYDPEGNQGLFHFDMNLRHLSNITYDVRVMPQQMLVLDTSSEDNDAFYGRVYASGAARISGRKGSVNMDITASTDGNSTFVMPLSSKSNISNADFVVFRQPGPTDTLDNVALKKLSFERRRNPRAATGSRMNIAMALDVRPDIEVELDVAGNTVKGRGEGALNLQINPSANVFQLYGDYTISEGSFLLSLQQIINKRFTIESGSSIQWTGSPMNALLDIDAVYKLKASLLPLLQGTAEIAGDRSVPVECVIHLGERLSNPAISFDVRVPGTDPETQTVIANALSTPETVDTQFLYLLLFNSFMSENASQSTSDIGSSVSAATGFEFLSNMVSNWLSSSDYNVVIRYRPKSELTSDEVDFGLSKSLINNRLFVELEGNYLIDNKQAVSNSMSNFMGEAYVTYLIDRAGTLKLKAFTQTIDRFDENQGLQETGIGIYFKEDFDNFRDLRQRIRDRFTNKKRKARRAERRAAREAAREAERGAEAGSGAVDSLGSDPVPVNPASADSESEDPASADSESEDPEPVNPAPADRDGAVGPEEQRYKDETQN